MTEKPRFPPPEEALRREGSAFRSPATPADPPAPKPIVVARADAPVDADDAKAPTKLTAEEVRALLAVEGATRQSSLGTVWRRGRVIVVPTGLISIALHVMFGAAGEWIATAVVLAAIAWTARPLFRRDGW